MQRMDLEDFAPGQVFRSPTYAVTEAEILDYARRYDPQPFHLEDAAARGTLFGGLAASGWHTASITMRLLVDSEFRPAWGVIGGRMERLEWPRPVRPGDVLRVETEVLEVVPSRSKPGQGMLRVRCTTLNQRDEPVQVILPNLIVPRRAG
ncbi:MaoC family dehydratase [Roseicella aquatilis]|uniref:MaoC family dehydratase n=1 Tax=Roseicella aquatilis TaxID=2527868 RepID=A0A4V2WJF2_9PROT|nr:MaoC family dehydratase [Roseicella aquatilis]TCZ52918.1 MaoC family dehydratase [Roseicella aquatilis]